MTTLKDIALIMAFVLASFLLAVVLAMPLGCAPKVATTVSTASPQLDIETGMASSQPATNSGSQTGGDRAVQVGAVTAGSSTIAFVTLAALAGLYVWKGGQAYHSHAQRKRTTPP